MEVKRKRRQRKQLDILFASGKVQTKQMKGRDKTMLQKKTEHRQEVRSE